MNTAIFLAGGNGNRLGGELPKQFQLVNGRMLFFYALLPLFRSQNIDEVVVVADPARKDMILAEIAASNEYVFLDKQLTFAEPGRNRQESILNGLRASSEGTKLVLIQDAARPKVTRTQIDEIFAALDSHDGVMPVLPMKDTVYMSEDGKQVSSLLHREQIFRGQAPELFRFQPYLAACEALLPEQILSVNGSTEPAVLAGMDIVMIPGDENNVKITTAPDLERFRKEFGEGIKG